MHGIVRGRGGNVIATVSLEHEAFTLVLPAHPQMDDDVQVPIFGKGRVTGLNPDYKGEGETWTMLRFGSGKESQFPYVLAQALDNPLAV